MSPYFALCCVWWAQCRQFLPQAMETITVVVSDEVLHLML